MAEFVVSIDRGLRFLASAQLPGGAFKVYRSTDPALMQGCTDDFSVFPASVIGMCLVASESVAAKAISDRIAVFLLDQMEETGLWRYWTRDHPYFDNMPPDLDDTATATAFLRLHGATPPDNAGLMLLNRNRLGQFYTWFVPRWRLLNSPSYRRACRSQIVKPVRSGLFWILFDSKPNDVDAVVNANILLSLGRHDAARPILAYLSSVIRDGREATCDKWYGSAPALYYAVSRLATIYPESQVHALCRERISASLMSSATPLQTALLICAATHYGLSYASKGRLVELLLSRQRDDGSWPAEHYYYGNRGRTVGFGSEELTTGFCIEALTRSAASRVRHYDPVEADVGTRSNVGSGG